MYINSKMRKFIFILVLMVCIFLIKLGPVLAREGASLSELAEQARRNIEKINNKQPVKLNFEQEGKTPQIQPAKPVIKANQAYYLGTVTKEQYPSEEKGPTAVTILDPYHPKHKGWTVPYFKDREGLKITPLIGIRGEYNQDEQLVGIESLILEAKEFDKEDDAELRKYVSTNDKHHFRAEVILHYKETWPVVIYIYQAERVTRQYQGKLQWSSTDMTYDHLDKRYVKVDYTVPNLPKIGYLDIIARYGNVHNFKPNDNAGFKPYDSYLLSLETMPFFDARLKSEFLYQEGTQPRYATVEDWQRYELLIELKKFFPRHFLTVTPHYKWEDEQQFPVTSNSQWVLHKAGVRLEWDKTGDLEFLSDFSYLDYARDKNRELANYQHISLKALSLENEVSYEFIDDVRATLGLDYSGGIDYSGFDNITIRGQLSYRKPGFADYSIGLRHTEYYNISDSIDTIFFKIGLFM
jgi:hypothetical protein